jgi:putative ABC transport system substrate-binding protein
MPFAENDPEAKRRYSAFTQTLFDLGWTDGSDVRIDLRWSGGDTNRIRALAHELVGLEPAIILTNGSPATLAVQRETRTIPIIFVNAADPVHGGIVTRNRPSGNTTGFANFEAALGGKWLELLLEIAPGLKRVALAFNPHTGGLRILMPHIEKAVRSLKVVPIITPVHSDVEIETAIIALGREPGGGLVSCRVYSRARIARRSYWRQPKTTYRRSMRYLSLSKTAVCSPTDPTS